MMKQVKRIAFLIFFNTLCVWPSLGRAADRDALVVLEQGDQIRGILLSLSQKEVAIFTPHSGILKFSAALLTRLDAPIPHMVQLNTGERIMGRLALRKKKNGRFLDVDSSGLVRKVAFLNVVAITPLSPPLVSKDRNPENAEEDASEDDDAEESDDSDGAPKSPAATVKSVGKPAEEDEDLHKLFLRKMSVLLDKGSWELEAGLMYSFGRDYDPSEDKLTITRNAALSVGLSMGLLSFIQGTLTLPLLLSYQHEYWYEDGREAWTRGLHPGDLSAGINVQLMTESGYWPDVIAMVGLDIPLGGTTFSTPGAGSSGSQGTWSTSFGLNFIKSADPITVYGGIAYIHSFQYRMEGQPINPGPIWSYAFGVGFAVNAKVSLNFDFQGFYVGAESNDQKRVVDSEEEPMMISSGMVYSLSSDWYFSPTVTFPINADGGDPVLGLLVARRL